VARLTRVQGVWIPDHAVFLDLAPDAAVSRVKGRGAKVDRHENPVDLSTAREGYLRVLEVVKKNKGESSTHVIPVESLGPGGVLAAAARALKPYLPESQGAESRAGALHEAIGRRSMAARIFTYRYLGRYLVRRFFEGAWREPFFPMSAPGRIFLRDGYSAGVMRLIYDQPAHAPLSDRIFYGYPLHRAVRDRLGILERRIEQELRKRLSDGGKLTIFTAPSGFAYDVLRPLKRLVDSDLSVASRVVLVAADLDPSGQLAPELTAKAKEIGVRLEFLRGDLTGPELRREGEKFGPFDLALFVGLSAWLPKPPMLEHLRWLRANLRGDGLLVTDCFTPAAYATGGAAMGYKASYYPPAVMKALLDYCGFDGMMASVDSGRDRINHVVMAANRV
jgi:hypothetical protein